MSDKPFNVHYDIDRQCGLFLSKPASHWTEGAELFWTDAFVLKQSEQLDTWQVWRTAPERDHDDDLYDLDAEWLPKEHIASLLLFSETAGDDVTKDILVWAIRAIQSAYEAGYSAGSGAMHKSLRNILLADTDDDRTQIIEAAFQIGGGL